MRKADVKAHFKTWAAVGRAIGYSRSAVQQWPDIVPEAAAYRLERVTDGALKVEPAIYEKQFVAQAS
jgi:transcriptional repressor of cell division inhibition gene dicB